MWNFSVINDAWKWGSEFPRFICSFALILSLSLSLLLLLSFASLSLSLSLALFLFISLAPNTISVLCKSHWLFVQRYAVCSVYTTLTCTHIQSENIERSMCYPCSFTLAFHIYAVMLNTHTHTKVYRGVVNTESADKAFDICGRLRFAMMYTKWNREWTRTQNYIVLR